MSGFVQRGSPATVLLLKGEKGDTGATGADGATGPAPTGTGLVQVVGGVASAQTANTVDAQTAGRLAVGGTNATGVDIGVAGTATPNAVGDDSTWDSQRSGAVLLRSKKGKVTTTDASTPVALLTLPAMPDAAGWKLRFDVIAIPTDDTDGSAYSWGATVVYRRHAAGVPTQAATPVQDDAVATGTCAAIVAPTFTRSGNQIVLDVTGVNALTLKWSGVVTLLQVLESQ